MRPYCVIKQNVFIPAHSPAGPCQCFHYPVHRKHRLNSLKGKMIRIFVKGMIFVLNDLLHMKVHIWNDQ